MFTPASHNVVDSEPANINYDLRRIGFESIRFITSHINEEADVEASLYLGYIEMECSLSELSDYLDLQLDTFNWIVASQN